MAMRIRAGTSKRQRKNHDAAARASTATGSGNGAGTRAQPEADDAKRFDLIPPTELPKRKRKPGELKLPKRLRDGGFMTFPGGQLYTQQPNLPPSAIPGVSATQALFAAVGRPQGVIDTFDNRTLEFLLPLGDNGPAQDIQIDLAQAGPSRHHRRRVKQHENWSASITPDLISLYLARKYDQVATDAPQHVCTCASRRTLNIMLVDWHELTTEHITICDSQPALQQLLRRGYFPCAPKCPSIAFSLDILELISLHSLNVSPNSTAWASTLEAYWARCGRIVRNKANLRKRLGNALTWYQVLDNRAEHAVSEKVDDAAAALEAERALERERASREPRVRAHELQNPGLEHDEQRPSKRARVEDADEEDAEDATRQPHIHSGPPLPPSGVPGPTHGDGDPSGGREAHGQTPTSDARNAGGAHGRAGTGSQPSRTLGQKCPLCFGGPRPVLTHTKAHVLVCLDANFSQKRRKCAESDQPLEFLTSRFLSQEEVDAMEQEVDSLRKRPAKQRTRGTSARVADDVLDQCEQSFIAAQEKVTKASKNYYSDTGLMALLCRHDRVLWVVNMDSPGERQHYALALLRKLGQELPNDWNVGVLYDIACQLSRSIEKWGLVSELADRLVFAVSVFHAYGHQWACQVVFHPRKRSGFGLTDGEGCERFWSAIRHLISGLRVSGYFRRLFILDRQISSMDAKALWLAGSWLRRRYLDARKRLSEAQENLQEIDVSEDELFKQWQLQIDAQLVKAQKQSARGADKIIDDILLSMGQVDELKQDIRDARKELRQAHKLTSAETHTITTRMEVARQQVEAALSRITTLQASLGTAQTRRLERMRGSAYLVARVNARALRANIRQSLMAHKFEQRKLERAYRHQVLQAKEHSQTKDLVHRRERTITSQVRKYNELVKQMVLLIRQGKKPTGKVHSPRTLDVKKLFKLDVDDDIWQEDPGLGPQDEGNLPRWQIDEAVQRGIIQLLQKRRCLEELERVRAEVTALGTWWANEKAVLERLCADEDERPFAVAISHRLQYHMYLRTNWLPDLALCGLRELFEIKFECEVSEAAHTILEVVVHNDEDSDDASDAYSNIEDEDVAVADMLDELAAAADVPDGAAKNDDDEPPAAPSPQRDVESGADAEEVAKPATPLFLPDSDDDSAPPPRAPSRTSLSKRAPHTYRAGAFMCRDEDLQRMVTPHAWLSGDGLAVFLMAKLLEAARPKVSIAHSKLLWDVDCFKNAANADSRRANKIEVFTAFDKLVPPNRAGKWLVLGHVVRPAHWTLIEVRWTDRTMRFYDSYSMVGGYDQDLKDKMCTLMTLCGEHFKFTVPSFTWIGESRDVRQTNGYDCGPFVAADAVSLMASDDPSQKTERDMRRFRGEMADCVRSRLDTRGEPSDTRPSSNAVVRVIDLITDSE